jgi:hypothetical protein
VIRWTSPSGRSRSFGKSRSCTAVWCSGRPSMAKRGRSRCRQHRACDPRARREVPAAGSDVAVAAPRRRARHAATSGVDSRGGRAEPALRQPLPLEARAAAGRCAGPKRAEGFHALRHFYAAVLLDGGESIKALSEYLSHADPGFTRRTYPHLMPSSSERTRRGRGRRVPAGRLRAGGRTGTCTRGCGLRASHGLILDPQPENLRSGHLSDQTS